MTPDARARATILKRRQPKVAGEPLHVGLFCPPPSYINGIVTYVMYMRDALRGEGHRVTVVSTEGIEDWRGDIRPCPPVSRWAKRIGGVQARLRPARGDIVRTQPIVLGAILQAHRFDPFDVIELEESFGWHAGLHGQGMIVVPRLHGPHAFGKDNIESAEAGRRSAIRIVAEGRALAKADGITSPSSRLLDASLGHYGLRHKIAAAIPNPMPTAAPEASWTPERADPDQLLCVGRFDSRKGADIVLKAFARAAAERSALRLVLAGPDYGVMTDRGILKFAEFLHAFIPPGLRERIDYRGNLKPAEVMKLRVSSAFSIIGSRFENFPYSLAESMAVGSATIVSDSFGNGEMVVDGETGLVVPIADVYATAHAILSLHGAVDRVAAMGHAAQERCRTWLAPDRIAREMAAFYRRAGA